MGALSSAAQVTNFFVSGSEIVSHTNITTLWDAGNYFIESGNSILQSESHL
jgi:hypothetical protein